MVKKNHTGNIPCRLPLARLHGDSLDSPPVSRSTYLMMMVRYC